MHFQVDMPQKMNDIIVANFGALTNIYDIQPCFIPLGHITSIDQQPTCPSHLSLDSLLVSTCQCPVSQSRGRESKGATYQVDYQGVLLWLIKMECAHNEGC